MIVTFHERKNVIVRNTRKCNVCADEFIPSKNRKQNACLVCIEVLSIAARVERRHRAKCKEAGVRA
jgi:formylmethanofuran dehydrogenase subunit E